MTNILNNFQVNKDTPLPMYYQIEQFLYDSIINGKIKTDECLPPELEMMKTFDVSRSTIRQAINNLVNKDMLYRKKGKGTYVKPLKIQEHAFQTLTSFNDEMVMKGHRPKTKVFELKVIDAIETVNKALHLSQDDKLIYMKRLRYADNNPVVYFETYIPYEKYKEILNEDMENKSLYNLFESYYGDKVNRVVRNIEVAKAKKDEAEYLSIKRNDPIFYITFTGYCNDNLPIEYSVSRYNGTNNVFVVEVKR